MTITVLWLSKILFSNDFFLSKHKFCSTAILWALILHTDCTGNEKCENRDLYCLIHAFKNATEKNPEINSIYKILSLHCLDRYVF